MASTRAFPGSNVMALVRNESSTDALVAMLASCPPVNIQGGGQRGTVSHQMELEAVVSCGQKRGYYNSAFEAGSQGEDLGGEEDLGDDCSGSGAHNVEKKRRLSFDQVRSLERNFEVENKLEPERKMQLAKELGLQPRQVAVWFQNRRARWKTKQLERDYEVLTLDYNRLKSDYDSIIQQKHDLQGEIECLTGKLQGEPETGPVEMGTVEKAKKRVPVSEVSVKAERVVVPGSELAPKREEGGSRDTCSDSLSSEVLDADSPRTMDSAPPPLEKMMISVEVPVDSTIVHVSDHLCDPMLSPQACQRISVKLEDGSFQDESSCNYMLSQLDEERGLPWWDWP